MLKEELLKLFNEPLRINNKIHHKKIMNQLIPLFEEALKTINFEKNEGNEGNIIWIFWWQGRENLTELSEKCFISIEKNKGKRKVVLITKYNLSNYIKLPKYIYRKFKEKKITLTHFSDIVRVNLLKKYGGLWLDATIYVTDSLDNVPQNTIFSLGFSFDFDIKNVYISKCKWSSFCLGAPSNTILFNFLSSFFNIYWKKYNDLLDYFIIDYALRYAWDNNIGNFKTEVSKYVDFEPHLYQLANCLNDIYNEKKWKSICKNNNIFKLSNKIFLINGNTFFNHLSKS